MASASSEIHLGPRKVRVRERRLTTLSPGRGLPDDLRSDLNSALLATGGIEKIQTALMTALAQTNWTGTVQAYVLELIRSGRATTYPALMDHMLRAVMAKPGTDMDEEEDADEDEQEEEENGGSKPTGKKKVDVSDAPAGLKIPDKVVDEGLRAVREVLKDVVEVE